MKTIYLLLNADDYADTIIQAFEDEADLQEKMRELVEADEKEGWLARYAKDKSYCWLTLPGTNLSHTYHYTTTALKEKGDTDENFCKKQGVDAVNC